MPLLRCVVLSRWGVVDMDFAAVGLPERRGVAFGISLAYGVILRFHFAGRFSRERSLVSRFWYNLASCDGLFFFGFSCIL